MSEDTNSLEEMLAKMEKEQPEPEVNTNAQDEPSVDLTENLDPAFLSGQELAKYIEKKAEQKAKQEAEKLKQKLAVLEQAHMAQLQERVQREIEEVKRANPDFDSYANDILKLSQQHPTLNVRQLYKLAKEERPAQPTGQEPPKPVTLASEKPTQSAARPPANATREEMLPAGRRSIRQIILEYQNRK